MSNWMQKATVRLKLAVPVGITLSNSEAKILLEDQEKSVKTLYEDESSINSSIRALNVDIDESISEASAALNQARGVYKKTKNPVLKREWARRMVIADRTVSTLVQTKKRTELTKSRLKMIAGDIKLELMAAEARAAETRMYVDAGKSLRLVGDKLLKARSQAKSMKIEYKNLEVTMEGAESFVSRLSHEDIMSKAEKLL